jgi:hypothetical protein
MPYFQIQIENPPLFIFLSFLFMAIFFYVLKMTIMIFAWWRVLTKMGYPGAISLLYLIPFVELLFPIVLAFLEWPLEKDLETCLKAYSKKSKSSPSSEHPTPSEGIQ